ncbi:MAG: sensor histidine kinase [Planctomycetota bacterium]|jgi:signal transduction histidine kinase
MLSKRLNISGYGQLRWVILLLAVAVILPTVCLLWFMSQAVKNVQLAARQKLITLYEERLDKASQETNQSWSEQFEELDKLVDRNLPSDICDNLFKAHCHSVIVYDEDGKRNYPLITADVSVLVDLAEEFRGAWRLEFAEQRLTEAIKLYEEKAQSSDTYVRLSALIGKARCLTKLGSSDRAVEVYKKVAFSDEEATCDTATLMLIANTRLLLVELVKPTLKKPETLETLTYPVFREELSKLLQIIRGQNEAGAVLPLDRSIFLAHRSIELAGAADTVYYEMYRDMPMVMYDMDMELFMDLQSLRGVLNEDEIALTVIERFPMAAEFRNWPVDQFRQLQLDEQTFCYGLRHNVGDKTILLLQPDGIFGLNYKNDFMGTGVTYRVLDNLGRVAAGFERPQGRPFLTARLGKYFTDWQVELYFEDDDIFKSTARRQITLYIWAGVLVIVLILAAGGFAGQVVSKQIRLNKIKNDFIATVSHELKTPLSSMRVLADTLLEGNYEDEKQAADYLKLICKENKRLSGLIDNFLTFSRMERNKQAFEMVKASPVEIAQAAAEAVRTEFSEDRCDFHVQISENLPDVLADCDAMVTVLVNLLDNAYKYSYDDKHIELRVFTEDSSVCFCVSDKGAGMSRRSAKKIFKRFYESKPGEGSTFTVRLNSI